MSPKEQTRLAWLRTYNLDPRKPAQPVSQETIDTVLAGIRVAAASDFPSVQIEEWSKRQGLSVSLSIHEEYHNVQATILFEHSLLCGWEKWSSHIHGKRMLAHLVLDSFEKLAVAPLVDFPAEPTAEHRLDAINLIEASSMLGYVNENSTALIAATPLGTGGLYIDTMNDTSSRHTIPGPVCLTSFLASNNQLNLMATAAEHFITNQNKDPIARLRLEEEVARIKKARRR